MFIGRWYDELLEWLGPFLVRLGHKKRRQMCPLYLAKLLEDELAVQTKGKRHGQCLIGGGRAVPRAVLFLGAMVAARYNPGLRAFSLRLLNNGKTKKAVLIAVARKLSTFLNAILRDRTTWTPKNA